MKGTKGSIIEAHCISAKISDLEINSDDIAMIIGKTEYDVLVNISLDYINKEPRRYIIVQTNNLTINLDLIKNKMEVIDKSGKVVESYQCDGLSIDDLCRSMHMAVLNDDSYNCDLEHGLRVLQDIERFKNS